MIRYLRRLQATSMDKALAKRIAIDGEKEALRRLIANQRRSNWVSGMITGSGFMFTISGLVLSINSYLADQSLVNTIVMIVLIVVASLLVLISLLQFLIIPVTFARLRLWQQRLEQLDQEE